MYNMKDHIMLPAWVSNVKRRWHRRMDKDKQKPSDIITSTSTHLVFVYGTLRKGQWNHYLLDRSKFLGMAKTKKRYALYGDGVPFLSRTRAVSQVTGEVYSVDDATLSRGSINSKGIPTRTRESRRKLSFKTERNSLHGFTSVIQHGAISLSPGTSCKRLHPEGENASV